ncbi:hypothetical protein BaRGS_00017901 [Batillaria attramentaria]|uniref:Uncharacterized protein n=1 Tax=Batillaria attramentaria TaxID=370345 RepID=A0ABD0KUJ9_9CAEN
MVSMAVQFGRRPQPESQLPCFGSVRFRASVAHDDHAFAVSSLFAGDIYDKLKYYEALESAHVVSRKRRSADTDTRSMFIQEVSFQAFQRDFNLVLYPGSPVLAKDFEVKSVDGEGNIETFFPDLNNIFTGHLSDNHSIPVDAHYEDGILSCTIWCPDETYSVEASFIPAWRHLPASTNGSMIVYRDSDIRWKNFELDSGPRCPDGVQLDPQINQNLSHVADDGNSSFHHDEHASERSKRQTIVKRACTLSVVSDFLFYYHVCGKSHQVCVAILISRINAADRIFRSTVWDAEKGFVDMGFQIKEILLPAAKSFARLLCDSVASLSSGDGKGQTKYNRQELRFDPISFLRYVPLSGPDQSLLQNGTKWGASEM